MPVIPTAKGQGAASPDVVVEAATWNTLASSTFYPELRPANQTEEVPIERG